MANATTTAATVSPRAFTLRVTMGETTVVTLKSGDELRFDAIACPVCEAGNADMSGHEHHRGCESIYGCRGRCTACREVGTLTFARAYLDDRDVETLPAEWVAAFEMLNALEEAAIADATSEVATLGPTTHRPQAA